MDSLQQLQDWLLNDEESEGHQALGEHFWETTRLAWIQADPQHCYSSEGNWIDTTTQSIYPSSGIEVIRAQRDCVGGDFVESFPARGDLDSSSVTPQSPSKLYWVDASPQHIYIPEGNSTEVIGAERNCVGGDGIESFPARGDLDSISVTPQSPSKHYWIDANPQQIYIPEENSIEVTAPLPTCPTYPVLTCPTYPVSIPDEFQSIINGRYSSLLFDEDEIINSSSKWPSLSGDQEILSFTTPENEVIDHCREAASKKSHCSYYPIIQEPFQGNWSSKNGRLLSNSCFHDHHISGLGLYSDEYQSSKAYGSGSTLVSDTSERILVPSKNADKEKLLSYEAISYCFSMPINEAAKQLHIGLTQLKKRCRQLDILRWPYRKLKSMKTLVNNVGGLMSDEGEAEGVKRRTIEMLEVEMKMIERDSGKKIDEETKKLRQACFKTKFKKRKLMELGHQDLTCKKMLEL